MFVFYQYCHIRFLFKFCQVRLSFHQGHVENAQVISLCTPGCFLCIILLFQSDCNWYRYFQRLSIWSDQACLFLYLMLFRPLSDIGNCIPWRVFMILAYCLAIFSVFEMSHPILTSSFPHATSHFCKQSDVIECNLQVR